MYSQDGMGLGHLRRSYTIAHAIQRRSPGCDILILADSPAISLFAPEPGIELMKLPTVIKTGDADWRNSTLSTSLRRLIRLRAALVAETLAEFRPDTVLVDHMPVGALGELKPMLDRALALPRPPRLFLGLRDILDRPAVIRRVWADLGAYDYLPVYDAVLVYGSRTIYDAATAYGLGSSAQAVRYCNYVTNGSHRPVTGARSESYVLMMGGGGGDAFPLAKAFVEAHGAVHRELGIDGVVLAGPNMSAADREALASLVAPPVRIVHVSGEPAKWIAGASAIVTMGGYNSLCEVLGLRKKALVVPRAGPSAEQRMRSALFAERALVRTLDPAGLEPEQIARHLLSVMADDTVPDLVQMPPLNGAETAANVLASRACRDEAADLERVPGEEALALKAALRRGLVAVGSTLGAAGRPL